jgi:hypothetical protein
MTRFVFLISALLAVACSDGRSQQKTATNEQQQQGLSPVVFPHLPEKMTFAGQEVILTDEDIIERLDREVLMNAYYNSATTGYFKRAHRWFPLIERILKEEGIPEDFKYLAVIESGLMQAISPVGAQGYWQFMPVTGKLYNLEISDEVDERLHIEKSTRAACQYLRDAYSDLNDWIWATASYNRGVGGVQQDMPGKEPNITSTPIKTTKQAVISSGYWPSNSSLKIRKHTVIIQRKCSCMNLIRQKVLQLRKRFRTSPNGHWNKASILRSYKN